MRKFATVDGEANPVIQLSESPLGAHYAGLIGMGAIEQTTRIDAVATQCLPP